MTCTLKRALPTRRFTNPKGKMTDDHTPHFNWASNPWPVFSVSPKVTEVITYVSRVGKVTFAY